MVNYLIHRNRTSNYTKNQEENIVLSYFSETLILSILTKHNSDLNSDVILNSLSFIID